MVRDVSGRDRRDGGWILQNQSLMLMPRRNEDESELKETMQDGELTKILGRQLNLLPAPFDAQLAPLERGTRLPKRQWLCCLR